MQTVNANTVEKEKSGLIERDIDRLLKLKIGDECVLDNYDAYYGAKVQNLRHGVGILRMNEFFIVHASWNHGVLDGELIAFDVLTKRCVAMMTLKDGIVENVTDVNKKDTLETLNTRRYLYDGREQWLSYKTMKPLLPFKIPSTRASYSIPDNSQSMNYSNLIEDFTIGKNCCQNDISPIEFTVHYRLQKFVVNQNSLTRVSALRCLNVPNLKIIQIHPRCFAEKKETYEIGEKTKKEFVIKACPQMKELTVDESCFYEFTSLQIIGMNSV